MAPAHGRPRRARLRVHAPGAALEGDPLRLLPAGLRRRRLAALRDERPTRQDPPRPRPARRHPPRAPGQDRRGPRVYGRRRRQHGAGAGGPQGDPGHDGEAPRRHILRRRRHGARARAGHAGRAARLLPHRLGDPGDGRRQLQSLDDGPLRAPPAGPDRAGSDPHARAPRERPRRRRAGDRPRREPGRPDPGPAPRCDRRRAGQAHHQDDGPALAEAGRELSHQRRDVAPGRGRQAARYDGAPVGAERHTGPAYLLPRAQGVDDHGSCPQERPGRRRRVEPAADQLLAERQCHRQVRAADAAQHRPAARDRARRYRLLRPCDPGPARCRQPHHGALLDSGGRRAREDPESGRPACGHGLPAAAHGGRVARPRLGPRRGAGLDRGDGLHHRVHAHLLPISRA